MEISEALALLRGKDDNEGVLWRGEEIAKLVEHLDELAINRLIKIVELERIIAHANRAIKMLGLDKAIEAAVKAAG